MEKAKTCIIRLLNKSRQEVGFIQWSSEGSLTASMNKDHTALGEHVASFLSEATEKKQLFVKRAERQTTGDGDLIVEKRIPVLITDESYPAALAAAINSLKAWPERIFAICDRKEC